MLNFVNLQGRLTTDPSLRYTNDNTAVCSFTLAVERDRKSTDGERQTDFFDCVAWRQGAEFVNKYFHKGSMAIVAGQLQSRKWEDKDGNKRTSYEIRVQNIYFCEKKSDDSSDNSTRSVDELAKFGVKFVDVDDADGELPF